MNVEPNESLTMKDDEVAAQMFVDERVKMEMKDGVM